MYNDENTRCDDAVSHSKPTMGIEHICLWCIQSALWCTHTLTARSHDGQYLPFLSSARDIPENPLVLYVHADTVKTQCGECGSHTLTRKSESLTMWRYSVFVGAAPRTVTSYIEAYVHTGPGGTTQAAIVIRWCNPGNFIHAVFRL